MSLAERYGKILDSLPIAKMLEVVKAKSGNAATFIIQQDKQYIKKSINKSKFNLNYSRNEFDKSGCNLTEIRTELKHRLRDYKDNKRKKEALEIDFMKDVTDISSLYAEFKADILKQLTEAQTSEEYKILTDIMSYKLIWLVRDIEDFTKKAMEKSFPSIESAQSKINEIKNTIAKLHEQLINSKLAEQTA